MFLTTTPSIEGKPIQDYLGIVTGEAIIGANILKDIMAAVRRVTGGSPSLSRLSQSRFDQGSDGEIEGAPVPASQLDRNGTSRGA